MIRRGTTAIRAETEFDPGWVECGGIRLACTPEREEEVHRQVAWARTFGLPLELLSALYHSAATGTPVELPIASTHPAYRGWLSPAHA